MHPFGLVCFSDRTGPQVVCAASSSAWSWKASAVAPNALALLWVLVADVMWKATEASLPWLTGSRYGKACEKTGFRL